MRDNSTADYQGGCLCGAVRYRISRFQPRIAHCHCTMCQRFHGAAFSTLGEVRVNDFSWLQGQSKVHSYRAENGTHRSFCSVCGSSLLFESPYNREDQTLEVAIATLDDPGSLQPDAHMYTDTQVPWITLGDHLPRYHAYRAVTEED